MREHYKYSLRSKRFRAVKEQRTRNDSQRPRENSVSKRASPHFHFLALVSFFAGPKPRIPFHGLSLLRNQTETLATQAIQIGITINLRLTQAW